MRFLIYFVMILLSGTTTWLTHASGAAVFLIGIAFGFAAVIVGAMFDPPDA